MGIHEVSFKTSFDESPVDDRYPLVKEPAKCISCLRCVSVCSKVQALSVWGLVDSGSRSRVDAVAKDDCSYCGQCITHCPVGALHERSDVSRVFDAIDDPETITIAQIAPSVRTSWHEGLDLAEDKASVGRMVAAVKSLGFDYVFDTDFAADVTIMEEDSGLHFLLKVNTELSDEELMQKSLQKGVKLNSLSAYYHDSPDDFAAHTFIINYSYLNTTGVEDAIKVLYDVIKK